MIALAWRASFKFTQIILIALFVKFDFHFIFKIVSRLNFEAGEKATFDCALEAEAPAQVTWLRNNKPLDDRFADRTVVASNEDGSATCSASLVVQVLTPDEREKMAQQKCPVFLVVLHDTELIEGTSVRFMIKVKGDPIPNVEL
jgi:hypothetical protein